MTDTVKVYTHNFLLTAAQCNAQRELAPAMLVQQIIEVSPNMPTPLALDSKTWPLMEIYGCSPA